jgi:hypothetical protein
MSDNTIAKITSSTVTAGEYTYIFVNRPNTSHIDVTRFKAAQKKEKPEQGKVAAGEKQIDAKEGPIAALPYSTGGQGPTHIALYFIAPNGGISEIKLDNASEANTNPTSNWRDGGEDLKFEREVAAAGFADSSSLLAATSRYNKPSVVFTNPKKPNDVNYSWYDDDDMWQTYVLPQPK